MAERSDKSSVYTESVAKHILCPTPIPWLSESHEECCCEGAILSLG